MAAPSAKFPLDHNPAVIPLPAEMKVNHQSPGYRAEGEFKVKLPSNASPQAVALGKALTDALEHAGYPWKNSSAPDAAEIILDPKLPGGTEAYKIDITPDSFTIRASAPAGVARAVQTIIQLKDKDVQGAQAFPALSLTDAPRFAWRGLMVDVGRYFRSVDEMKRIIDLMAFYKLNTLHWHLTEDQGWRIEIKKYPKLTEIGSRRPSSPVMGNRDAQDGVPYSGFYTQDQIRDIVAYAKSRHVTIIPEIELPGHAAAAIASYPELGNSDIPGYAPKVMTTWGVHNYTFAPTEKTFEFLSGVIDEVCELFPDAPYIHIGGDEAPKDQWDQSPQAKKIMATNNLANSHELQSWFIRRIERIVNAKGKRLIGWDEIVEGGLSPTATMMYWRAWQKDSIEQAIAQGNHLVMTPNSHCYFDYGQGETPKEPQFDFIRDKITPEKLYSFDPLAGIPEKNHETVLGVQCNIWSEYMPTIGKFEYQVFPRALALAEVGWSPQPQRDFKKFEARWHKHEQTHLRDKGVNFRTRDGGRPAISDKM